jgi:DnaJ-class molecular chaperone
MDGFKDMYAVLGVAPTAAPEVIRAAYRALALRHHPDRRHTNSAVDGSVMAELNKAYEVLSCPESRRVYDQSHQRAQLASAQRRGHAYLNQAPNTDQTASAVLTTYDRVGRLHAYA